MEHNGLNGEARNFGSATLNAAGKARIHHIKLSPREVEVLELVAAGLGSKEAADVLVVSKRTVDFHLTRIYRKLGAGNRVLALTAARRAGILPAEL